MEIQQYIHEEQLTEDSENESSYHIASIIRRPQELYQDDHVNSDLTTEDEDIEEDENVEDIGNPMTNTRGRSDHAQIQQNILPPPPQFNRLNQQNLF